MCAAIYFICYFVYTLFTVCTACTRTMLFICNWYRHTIFYAMFVSPMNIAPHGMYFLSIIVRCDAIALHHLLLSSFFFLLLLLSFFYYWNNLFFSSEVNRIRAHLLLLWFLLHLRNATKNKPHIPHNPHRLQSTHTLTHSNSIHSHHRKRNWPIAEVKHGNNWKKKENKNKQNFNFIERKIKSVNALSRVAFYYFIFYRPVSMAQAPDTGHRAHISISTISAHIFIAEMRSRSIRIMFYSIQNSGRSLTRQRRQCMRNVWNKNLQKNKKTNQYMRSL